MSNEKEQEALKGTEEETVALNDSIIDGAVVPVGDGELDSSRARFINHDKGDAANAFDIPGVIVNVDGKTKLDDQFVGLTKAELMQYANDPYWKKVRLALLILFWVGWFGMLAASIIIIVLAPKCPPRPNLDWWQEDAMYEVYPKSFEDSDADGVGDFTGIYNKMNYLHGEESSLNVSSLLLGNILPHSGTAGEITDFTSINPEFGTMQDFEQLRVAMHKKGMKLVIDFVPNHSGKDHEWFEKSVNREDPYTDYYIWASAKQSSLSIGRQPPNDWQDDNGESLWEYHTVREEYYLHQNSADEPELNLRNEAVLKEFDEILKFWMEQGVDGFLVRDAPHLVECGNITESKSDCLSFYPDTYKLMTRWRQLLTENEDKTDKIKLLFAEVSGATDNQTAMFYQYEDKAGAHMTTNDVLTKIKAGCDVQCVLDAIQEWVSFAEAQDPPSWGNWRLGDSYTSRLLSRFNGEKEYINVFNMIMMTLPGTSISYYGDEIGMHDLDSKKEDDSVNLYRTPMQWTPGQNAGFTSGNSTPWMSIPDDYINCNVKTQMAHGSDVSNLEVFQQLAALKKEESIQFGELHLGLYQSVLFYVRQATRFPGFLVAVNFGDIPLTLDFVQSAPVANCVPDKAKVWVTTANMMSEDYRIGTEADLSNLVLSKLEGVVFRWEEDPLN